MPTILVADDNSNIQKMVSLVFQEKGIRVVAVGNGEAACRKVPEVKPDIVLADVFMPVRNGYEVCEFVKRDSRFSETPVILLVGAFDPLDEKEAQRVGADGVLKKPFVPPEPLIAMVGSLLQKAEKPEEPPVEAPAESPAPPPIVAVAPPPPPPPPREYHSEPEVEEYAYGTASRDSDMADNVTTTVREPVATPFAAREEPQDDNTESASDWKRRREAMEYDIPAEESANLVEHLAGEQAGSAATEEEDRAKDFEAEPGSAPEEQEAPSPEAAEPERPHVSPREWMNYMSPAENETAAPASGASEADNASSATRAHESETAAPVEVLALAPSHVDAPVSYAPAREEVEEHTEAPATEIHADAPLATQEESPAPSPSVIPFPAAESQESHDEYGSPEPIFAAEEVPAAHSAVEQAVHEAIAQPETAKQAPMDQETIDNIVAKVVAKLEPQLHQALSQGVLRPLIQELLKGELKADK
ncbi:MAG TPA: response regulator [Candidatus Acidoferrales bacterium]|nr:response regulator [Candidatus Acidoferrales bacterium]